jgi:hypothetical protein
VGVTATLVVGACTASHPADTDGPDAAHSASASGATDASESPSTPGPVSLPCGRGAPRHLVGARHHISGDVFGWPLRAPPDRDHANKILWRTRHSGGGDLFVAASLNGSTVRVHRHVEQSMSVGTAMPSIINVPQAGCWTFSLRWGHQRDLVAVRYSAPG